MNEMTCFLFKKLLKIHVIVFFLFLLMFYVPVNNFSVMSGVFLSCTSSKQRIKRLAKGHNTVTLMSLELATL